MTRIIAGIHGGRRLAVPASGATRPTTDRIREALFSRLDHLGALEGADVLDLYAGSGALGLEALSRGARHAHLVDSGSAAVRTARRNVEDLGAAATVVSADVTRYLRRFGEMTATATAGGTATATESGAGRWDVVFLDPPYDLEDAALAEVLDLLVPHLRPDALVVVERSTRSAEPGWPAGLERFATKAYGETTLWYAEPGDVA